MEHINKAELDQCAPGVARNTDGLGFSLNVPV